MGKTAILNYELLELGKVIQKETLATLISCYQVMLPKALKAKQGRVINKRFETFYKINEELLELIQKAKLEAEAIRLEREKESLMREVAEEKNYDTGIFGATQNAPVVNTPEIAKSYRLVNVIGAGSQLQATVENLTTKQTKRISVGKKLDDFSVKSISLEDGVVFVAKDGSTQTLNVTTGN